LKRDTVAIVGNMRSDITEQCASVFNEIPQLACRVLWLQRREAD
jgi:hypothetical protein